MKFFTNKKIWSKIVILLVVVILFQCVGVKPSYAVNEDTIEFGGKLLSPIISLVVTLADAIMDLMQSTVMGISESLMEVDMEATWYKILAGVFTAILVAVIAIVCIATGGAAALALGILTATALTFGGVGEAVFEDISGYRVSAATYSEENLPGTLYLPAFALSPEEVFQGKVLLFNVNFFEDAKEIKEKRSPKRNEETGKYIDKAGNDVDDINQADTIVEYYYYIDDNDEEVKTSKQDIAQELKGIVSKWYVSLRNIALVGMMIVLLYIGIRMLISTVASDKAKYKTMIQDWLIGMILLVLMHYIMAFSVTIVERITNIISSSIDNDNFVSIIPDDEAHKLTTFIKNAGLQDCLVDEEGNPSENGPYLAYPTNLIGQIRIKAQLCNWGTKFIGYSLCYVVLVMFTLFFIITYLRRVLYMAFLTIIAPIVALTYPIDKISDGSAQGFNKWLKEYIFNLLIQPLHLLLYYILVTSAFNLASNNAIYSLVAIGFMIPAEKLLRGFFGFEKASTPGVLEGAAGGALAMSAINSLKGLGKGHGGSGQGGKDKGSSGEERDDVRKPRFKGDVDESVLFEGENSPERSPQLNAPETQNSESEYDERLSPEQIDELNAEGIEPGDQEYNQFLRNHGIEPNSQETAQIEDTDNAGDNNRQPIATQTEQQSGTGTPQPTSAPTTRMKRKRLTRPRAKRMLHSAGAAALSYGLNTLKSVPGTAIRFTGKAAGAVALGSIGLAAGIASGDPSKALTNTLAGGAAGIAVGGRMADVPANGLERIAPGLTRRTDPIAEARRVKNSRQYEELVKEDYIAQKEKEYKKVLRANFDKKDVERMYNDGTIERYIKNGVDDVGDIVTAERMRREDPIISQENDPIKSQSKAITIAKYAKRVGKDYDNANAAEWRGTFADEYQHKKGMTKDDANKAARETMNYVTAFNKLKKSNYK